MNVETCHLIDLPKITDIRGNLSVLEANRHVPFSIERVYFLYDVPLSASRAGHAHKLLQQVLIAIAGSFDVLLKDGMQTKTIRLNRPDQGLYICPLIWRELHNFSENSICLVAASAYYEEGDYYRDYQEYVQAILMHV